MPRVAKGADIAACITELRFCFPWEAVVLRLQQARTRAISGFTSLIRASPRSCIGPILAGEDNEIPYPQRTVPGVSHYPS